MKYDDLCPKSYKIWKLQSKLRFLPNINCHTYCPGDWSQSGIKNPAWTHTHKEKKLKREIKKPINWAEICSKIPQKEKYRHKSEPSSAFSGLDPSFMIAGYYVCSGEICESWCLSWLRTISKFHFKSQWMER